MIAFGESIFKEKDDRWARMFKGINLCGALLIGVLFAVGCAHYPLNQPVKSISPVPDIEQDL